MNEWKALYLKELKEHRTVFIFLLAITAATGLVSAAAVGWDSPTPSNVFARVDGVGHSFSSTFSPYMLWALFPYIILFILPFLLTHSFAQEIKGQTNYLLLSLPTSRVTLFLCKIIALMSVGVAVFVMATAATHVLYLRLIELADTLTGMSVTRIAAPHLWLLVGEIYFGVLFVLLGIASGIAGLRLVIKRFQGLMAALFVGCVVFLYVGLLSPAREVIKGLVGTYRIPLIEDGGDGAEKLVLSLGWKLPKSIPSGLDLAIYSVLFGIVLIGLGVFLFHRRAEV